MRIRFTLPCLLLALVPLAAACAHGSDGTGLSGSGGASSTTATTSSGAACGVQSSLPACNTCVDKSCCTEAEACVADPVCPTCLGTSTPPAGCATNTPLATFAACLTTSCNTQCMSSSGGPPTTCTGANGGPGCCQGNDLYYCNSSNTVTHKTCSGGKVCGWNTTSMYYDCVSPPGGPDPSGVNPITCAQ